MLRIIEDSEGYEGCTLAGWVGLWIFYACVAFGSGEGITDGDCIEVIGLGSQELVSKSTRLFY